MIKKIRIQNYMRHADTTINFKPGVNILIGATGAGKSSVIYAIQSVALNSETELCMLKWGASKYSNTLYVDDYRITRFRSKGTNGYIVQKKGEKPQKYGAIGTKVPEEVQNILQLSDLNFQRQHDAPFWLNKYITGGGIFKAINKLVDLEVIDTSQKYLKSMRAKNKIKLELLEEDIDADSKEIELYKDIDKLQDSLQHYKAQEQSLKSSYTKFTNIQNTLAKIIAYKKQLQQIAKMLEDFQHLAKMYPTPHPNLKTIKNTILEIIQHRHKKKLLYIPNIDKLEQLHTRCISNYDKTRKLIEIISNYDKTAKQYSDLYIPNIDKLEQLFKIINSIKQKTTKIKSILDNHSTTCNLQETCKLQITELEKELKERIGDICPLCLQPVK